MAFVAPLVAGVGSAVAGLGAGGLSTIGAGVTAASTLLGGIAQSNAASYQAQIASMNQQIANQNAEYATQAGQAKVYQQGQEAAQKAGLIKASQAANGVDVNTGSALNVQTGQRQVSLLDAQTAQNNAELEAYGYKSQAASYGAQAALGQSEAAEAPFGAALTATGGLLGGASGVNWKWLGGLQSAGTSPASTSNGFSVGGA